MDPQNGKQINTASGVTHVVSPLGVVGRQSYIIAPSIILGKSIDHWSAVHHRGGVAQN